VRLNNFATKFKNSSEKSFCQNSGEKRKTLLIGTADFHPLAISEEVIKGEDFCPRVTFLVMKIEEATDNFRFVFV